jgi:hypothetical protein
MFHADNRRVETAQAKCRAEVTNRRGHCDVSPQALGGACEAPWVDQHARSAV